MTNFSGLELAQPILRAIEGEGYSKPTPIQSNAIPPLLAGRDLLGIAQTGTGKTAAFALPLLHHLAARQEKPLRHQPRALILAPTRELAAQISASIKAYGQHLGLRSAAVFGGARIGPQIKALTQGVHILVATPGRLIDLMNQKKVRFDAVEIFILDEADRMLDMGFIGDVRKISAKMPRTRQTALFSATMPKSVHGLAKSLLNNPVRVEAAPESTTAEKVAQKVFFVAKDKKRSLLSEVMKDTTIKRVLIFTRTKHGADRVSRHLGQIGIEADVIHGNKSQNYRQKALKSFRSGRIRALVATDIAARGIDVAGITHVINFDLPMEAESYVHRIGRTARAGAEGIAFSFCDAGERGILREIEKIIRQSVPVNDNHPFHGTHIATGEAKGETKEAGPRQRRPQRGKRPHKGKGSTCSKRNDQTGQKKTNRKPGKSFGQNQQRRNKPNRSRRVARKAA